MVRVARLPVAGFVWTADYTLRSDVLKLLLTLSSQCKILLVANLIMFSNIIIIAQELSPFLW